MGPYCNHNMDRFPRRGRSPRRYHPWSPPHNDTRASERRGGHLIDEVLAMHNKTRAALRDMQDEQRRLLRDMQDEQRWLRRDIDKYHASMKEALDALKPSRVFVVPLTPEEEPPNERRPPSPPQDLTSESECFSELDTVDYEESEHEHVVEEPVHGKVRMACDDGDETDED